MADDAIDFGDGTLEGAADAFNSFLNPKVPEVAKEPAKEAKPDPDPDQSTGPAETENTEGNAVETAASETPETEPAKEPAKPIVYETSHEVQNAVAEASKARQESEIARNQFLNALNTYIPQLDAAVKGQFADIKTQDDLLMLGDPSSPKYNPDRYNAAVIAFTRLNNAQNAQQALVQQQQKIEQAEQQKVFATEQTKLYAMIPDLANPDKGPTLERKLVDFAKSKGISPNGKTAAEIATLYEAMQFRDLQAKQIEATKKASVAPPVQKPGTPRNTNGKQDKLEADWKRFEKTGHLDDAANIFKSILN